MSSPVTFEEKPKEMNDTPAEKHFALYQHLKHNILQADMNCKEAIGKDSIYCLDCKTSSCPECGSASHEEHSIINREKYLKISPTFFNGIDKEIFEFKALLGLRSEYETHIEETFRKLHSQLDKMHQLKLEELDKIFKAIKENINQLQTNKNKIKQEITDFYDQTAKLFSINGNNFDRENTFLLMGYDMMSQCEKKNNDVLFEIREQKEHLAQYKKDIVPKANEVIEQYKLMLNTNEKLGEKFDDFYWDISIKANKYFEHMKKMRTALEEIMRTTGNFNSVGDLVRVMDSKNKKGIDYIFSQNFFTSHHSSSSKSLKPKESFNQRPTESAVKKSSTNVIKKSKSLNKSFNYINQKPSSKQLLIPHTNSTANIDSKPIPIALDTQQKQRYFAYSIIDLYNKNFNDTKQRGSIIDINARLFESYQDRYAKLKDQARPISGTNDIHVYNPQTQSLTKKKIQLEKDKQGYTVFPNGYRHIIIKDWIYITGGVDSMKTPIKVCNRVNMQSWTVERLEQMPKVHSYHGIEYLENYDCFIVLGGENNNKACDLFDLSTNKWTPMPDMILGRSNVNIYYDACTSEIYAMFGMKNALTDSYNNLDSIEVLELNDVDSGWVNIDYYKSSLTDFKRRQINVVPFTKDKLLLIGGKNGRSKNNIYAFYLINKNEIIQVDQTIIEEIKIEENKIRNKTHL